MERKQENIGKLVARRDGEFVICDYVFDHGDGFKGATGTWIRPVSQSEYDERTSPEAILEYVEEPWKEAVAHGGETDSLESFAERFAESDGVDSIFDQSGSQYWDQIRAKGYSDDEYPIMECTGGGRCFSVDETYDEVFDEELLARIRTIETPSKQAV